MTRILTLSVYVTTLIALAALAHAAPGSYNRPANASNDDVQITHNCNPDGSGTFSYTATGTMDGSGNPVTTSGTSSIVFDQRTQNWITTTFSGSWIESDPVLGDTSGTFSIKKSQPGRGNCNDPLSPTGIAGLENVSGYLVGTSATVTFIAQTPMDSPITDLRDIGNSCKED